MAMSVPSAEYRFIRDEYTNRAAHPYQPRRAKRINVRKTTICIACGIQRSATNKCECNS
jgi:hypothetical protein